MAFTKKRSGEAERTRSNQGGSQQSDTGALQGSDAEQRERPGNGTRKRSGSEKRKRQPIIGFRATDEERLQIETAAREAGHLSISSFVRARSLAKGAGHSSRRTPAEIVQLAQLLGMMGAAGGALQRLEQKYLSTGEPLFKDELEAAIGEFRETAAAILRALGKRPLSSIAPSAEANP